MSTNVKNLEVISRDDSKYSMGLHYETLFDPLDDGVCIVNKYAIVEYVNSAYEKILNVSASDLLGVSIYSTHNDEILLKGNRGRKKIKGYLNRYSGKEDVSVSVSPIYIEKEYVGLIGIYRVERLRGNLVRKDLSENSSENVKCPEIKLSSTFSKIIGESKEIRQALLVAEKASKVSVTVLIRGASGTGKELVANAIHQNSKRCDKPFIKVNCASIPSGLLESELFGHEKGSFTGAICKKIGKFEAANKGTIFLDEIGDMPIDMQVKLLRVLQENEFERVGGNEVIKCDVRIIAATHCDLEVLMEKGLFREDLYYRLNVIPIILPKLEERREDIIPLIEFFINKTSVDLGIIPKQMTDSVLNVLVNYNWPGNIRELENLIKRLMVLVETDTVGVENIPSHISGYYRINYNDIVSNSLIKRNYLGEMVTLEEYEKEIIKMALKEFGTFSAAAKTLGVTHKTVATKARKYKIVD
ncbi:MAG: sigma 54-interacting transcriptional regulator [Clostridiales bacterium]|nr:sigma 54-interacting transcriptional regulator [Clostridiales bacterium]